MITAERVLQCVEITVYSLTATLGAYNVKYFVIEQERYKIYFISSFYVLSLLVLISRILSFAFLLVTYSGDEIGSKDTRWFRLASGFTTTATVAKVGLGYFQVVSMVLLTYEVNQRVSRRKFKKIKFWLELLVSILSVFVIITEFAFVIPYYYLCERAGEITVD